MMMQMLLSAGFPEKLLEKHSQIAFRNVFFKKKRRKNIGTPVNSVSP